MEGKQSGTRQQVIPLPLKKDKTGKEVKESLRCPI